MLWLDQALRYRVYVCLTIRIDPFEIKRDRGAFTQESQISRNLIMTEEEITAVLDKAHACVESECSVDDIDSLIAELKDQQKVLSERLEHIMNVVAHLQKVNAQKERKADDVRAIVKDMLRVFTTQVCWWILSFFNNVL